jgi:hypothetical protein
MGKIEMVVDHLAQNKGYEMKHNFMFEAIEELDSEDSDFIEKVA